MCRASTGKAYDRPLHADDVPLIAAHYEKCLGEGAIAAIVAAITDNHHPQPAVLIAVLEMAGRAKHRDVGMYPWPMMPFSALDLDTLERVQTEAMAEFHSVFESMALAERNVGLLNGALASKLGTQIRLVCDCGCISDGMDEDVLGSVAYARINDIRSLAEAVGTKVVRITNFQDADWLRRNLDMGSAEMRSYDKMWCILQSLPSRTIDLAASARANIAFLHDLKVERRAAA
jgi:hypothetical protein